MLDWFSFGPFSLVFAVVCPVLYLGLRKLRTLAAWVGNTSPPKERTMAMVVINAILGLVLGCLIQTFVDRVDVCRTAGVTVLPCVLKL